MHACPVYNVLCICEINFNSINIRLAALEPELRLQSGFNELGLALKELGLGLRLIL